MSYICCIGIVSAFSALLQALQQPPHPFHIATVCHTPSVTSAGHSGGDFHQCELWETCVLGTEGPLRLKDFWWQIRIFGHARWDCWTRNKGDALVGKASTSSDLLALLVAIVSQMNAPPLPLEGVGGLVQGRALWHHIPTKYSWLFLSIIPSASSRLYLKLPVDDEETKDRRF